MRIFRSLTALLALLLVGCAAVTTEAAPQTIRILEADENGKVQKSDAEWRSLLTERQYYILRDKGTELAFSGAYNKHKGEGVYRCAACGHALFDSETKFDSGTGWPSFYAPHSEQALSEISDRSHGMVRTEVLCDRCGGHLGHVFHDGPKPTGLRYCINSAALQFDAAEVKK